MKRILPPTAVLIIALLVPSLNLIPVLHAYASDAPPDRVFMGFRYMAGDHYQYAAFIRQVRDHGDLLMANPFTSEAQRPSYLLLYFWILGTFSRLTGASVVLTWEIFRLLGGFLYVVVFWHFSGLLLEPRGRRVMATLLFGFGGGIDWIVTGLRATVAPWIEPLEYPYDYFWNWSTFGTMVVPNWIWPALVMLLAWLVMLKRTKGAEILAFLLFPVVWFLHPYSGMVAYLSAGLLAAAPVVIALARLEPIPWKRVRSNLRISAPALASFAVVAAYLLWARSDEVFRLNSARGFTWTDTFSVWWYPLSYGALLPLAFFGLRSIGEDREAPADAVVAWAAAAFFLSVNPLYAGVKFHYLLFPPLVILAARGLFRLQDTAPRFRRALRGGPAVALGAACLFLDAPVSLVKDLPAVAQDGDITMRQSEIDAMRWLEGQPDGLVLSSYRAGNRIPWLAGKPVYVGHWFMTLDSRSKSRDVAMLMSPQVPHGAKTDILGRTGARWVYVGPDEASMGSIDESLPLTKVYDSDGVAIYESALAR